jgi:hypothetical protein
MTPHFTHISSLRPSYRHCIVHTADGSPLSVAGQGTLSSDSFHVPDVSLVPDLTIQLMSARQIADHDYHVILDPDVCYIQGHRTGPHRRDSQRLWELDWLVFLLLRSLVLLAPPVMLRPHRRLLSGIIVWVIFLSPDYLLCFFEVF